MTDIVNLNENSISDVKNKSLVELYSEIPILTGEDRQKLLESQNFMVSTFQSVPMYRTLPIKLFGVLCDAQFPTPETKFFQCKIEAEVHSTELVKELHELELMKIELERGEYLLNVVMKNKFEKESDEISKQEIMFDIRKQSIILSNKRFDMALLQKKIKYRIMEISEWKTISEKIAQQKDFNNISYDKVLLQQFELSFKQKLIDPKVSDSEKDYYIHQLQIIQNYK